MSVENYVAAPARRVNNFDRSKGGIPAADISNAVKSIFSINCSSDLFGCCLS
jgi:hypothetical protein